MSLADTEVLPSGEPSNAILFESDSGQAPLETRKVLVSLLKGPYIDGTRAGDQWAVLVRDEALLRSRCHDLFLELVVDTVHKVAFTRPVEAAELDAPSLLRSRALTFLDSVLLLHLRQQLLEAEGQGVRAAVSLTDMAMALQVYESTQNTDHATYVKRVNAAIERVKDMHLLRKLADDRFEVSPVLRLIFDAQTVQALSQLYREAAGEGTADQKEVGGSPDQE